MNRTLAFSVLAAVALVAALVLCEQSSTVSRASQSSLVSVDPLMGTMGDYFGDSIFLHRTALDIVAEMSVEEQAGVLFMPAWESNQSLDSFLALIERYHLRNAMVLRTDATPEQTRAIADALSYTVDDGQVAGLLASDAEPSLVGIRFPQEGYNTPTNTLDSLARSQQAAHDIAFILHRYGYNTDFAPVYDSALNRTVIGNRAYSTDRDLITELAGGFARVLEQQGIVATAKHFPGHGYAVGDTHVSLQSIPGILPERSVFQQAVDDGIALVMVGHLAIDGGSYDTDGLPSTVSSVAISKLLLQDMGYQGVVITDAMNMGALSGIDSVDMRALEAGTDIVLMPRDIDTSYRSVVEKMKTDPVFAASVHEKVYRIVRLSLVREWVD